jgi:uncharacterized protein YwqG
MIFTMTAPTDLSALARELLPADVAEKWIPLLRPGIRLVSMKDDNGPAVGYLGGDPELPANVPWPKWKGNGWLTFIAAIDCAALPVIDSGTDLPRDGTLLFFYFDGQVDNGEELVSCSDPRSMAGTRVLYVPAGTPVATRHTPKPITPYPRVPLSANPVMTAPAKQHPVMRQTFGPQIIDDWHNGHPLWGQEFRDALWHHGFCQHQLGGYAMPVQDPVEYEVARTALGGNIDGNDPSFQHEAAQWVLLAQLGSDSDAKMTWGDVGMLYWLIRPKDLAAQRFDQALFTWQCS